MDPRHKGKIFMMIVLLGPLVVFAYGYIVMLLWNWLLPDITGVAEISFWQSLGLILLAKLLFGFGGGGFKKTACKYRQDHWKNKLKSKWSEMSPDERSKMQEWKDKFCS